MHLTILYFSCPKILMNDQQLLRATTSVGQLEVITTAVTSSFPPPFNAALLPLLFLGRLRFRSPIMALTEISMVRMVAVMTRLIKGTTRLLQLPST